MIRNNLDKPLFIYYIVNRIHGFDIKYFYDYNTIYEMQPIYLYNPIRFYIILIKALILAIFEFKATKNSKIKSFLAILLK